MADWFDAAFLEWSGPQLAHMVRIAFAVVLGGAIGFERELRDKPAGFRTIILICLGACVFSIVSQSSSGTTVDNTRIAAQIVSGIGFLGAGAILRDRQSVFGLTTAATIWTVAAVGMAAGFGMLALATVGTVAVLVALWLFDILEQCVGNRRDIQEYDVQTANSDDALPRLRALFAQERLRVRKWNCYEDGASLVFHFVAMGAKTGHDRLRMSFARSSEYTLMPR